MFCWRECCLPMEAARYTPLYPVLYVALWWPAVRVSALKVSDQSATLAGGRVDGPIQINELIHMRHSNAITLGDRPLVSISVTPSSVDQPAVSISVTPSGVDQPVVSISVTPSSADQPALSISVTPSAINIGQCYRSLSRNQSFIG